MIGMMDFLDMIDTFFFCFLARISLITLFSYYCLLNPGVRIQKTHEPLSRVING